jgi:hypothetical protein
MKISPYKQNRIYTFFLILTLVSLLAGCNTGSKTQYREISVEEYSEKMLAGWLGQMIGVGWAGPTEFKWQGEIIPEADVPEWDPDMINCFGQDDLYVEMTFLRTLEQYGYDVSIRQAGIDFANSEYFLWGANELGRANLQKGIAPPDCSHPELHHGADWIDYQIEADYSGLISPGLPNAVIALGEKFGRLVNYGDGLYAGQFVGAMYAEAFFEKDINKIIEAGLEAIPSQSQYAECIRDVVQWHNQYPTDWQNTWKLIHEKYYENPDYRKYEAYSGKYWHPMDAKLNGAFIVLGLLYGNGNLDSTVVISMRAGYDSDCNPSNAAGVLLTSQGLDNLDERFTKALKWDEKFSYTDYDLEGLKAVCTQLAREIIAKYGGKTQMRDGKEYLIIPVEKPVPSAFVQSWEPEPLGEPQRYTQEEMDKIKYWSYLSYIPLTEKLWTPENWKIYFANKNADLEMISWMGKNNVIPVSGSQSRPVNLVVSKEADSNTSLRFSVSHEPGKKWNLKVQANYHQILLNETIGSETSPNGWKDYTIDLSKFKGSNVTLIIGCAPLDDQPSIAYWHNVRLE